MLPEAHANEPPKEVAKQHRSANIVCLKMRLMVGLHKIGRKITKKFGHTQALLHIFFVYVRKKQYLCRPKEHSTRKMMKKTAILLAALVLSVCSLNAQVAKILGDWYTVDDKTGDQLSVVHIYKAQDGKFYGKIIHMLDGDDAQTCTACEGADAGKPLVGLVIIRGFEEKDGKLVGGRVLDPDNGKFYYGKISMKGEDLVLRGSLDKAGVLGRSQTWKRKK